MRKYVMGSVRARAVRTRMAGRTLDFDPIGMRVMGDDEANGMLTKEYRAPFTLPQQG